MFGCKRGEIANQPLDLMFPALVALGLLRCVGSHQAALGWSGNRSDCWRLRRPRSLCHKRYISHTSPLDAVVSAAL